MNRVVMDTRIEKLCVDKGMKMTEQRRVIARVLSLADDHPDVEEVHRRASPAQSDSSAGISRRSVRPVRQTTPLGQMLSAKLRNRQASYLILAVLRFPPAAHDTPIACAVAPTACNLLLLRVGEVGQHLPSE